SDAFRLCGTAVRIDPESMVLRLRAESRLLPRLGDQVHLEIHLPGDSEGAPAKDLAIRARIVSVSEAQKGEHHFVLSFRRAQFKDRSNVVSIRKRAAAPQKWEM